MSARRSLVTFALTLTLAPFALVGCSSPADLKVGDCAAKDGDNSISPTECDGDDAAYKVVSIKEKVSEIQAGVLPCSGVKDADVSFFMGEQGKPNEKSGTLYCLQELSK